MPDKRLKLTLQKSLSQQSENDQLVTSEMLMDGKRERQILHNGEYYRLTITKNNKLILTK